MTCSKCIYTIRASSYQKPTTPEMSLISVKSLKHYNVMYGLNSRKLREGVLGHQSVQWRFIQGCFRDICAFGVDYKRAKGYDRADFNASETSTINEVKSKKDPVSCFKCSGSHFQHTSMKYTNQSNNRFLSKTNYKEINNLQKFCISRSNNNMFSTGTLSFKVLQ